MVRGFGGVGERLVWRRPRVFDGGAVAVVAAASAAAEALVEHGEAALEQIVMADRLDLEPYAPVDVDDGRGGAWRKMRIRAWLLVVVFAVWISAATGFGLLTWNLHEQKTAALLNQVRDAADAVSTVVERELDKRVVLARALASSRAVRDGDFARFHDEATVAMRGTKDWALLASADELLVTTHAAWGAGPVRRAMPRALTESAPAFIFSPKSPVTGAPLMTVYVPVPGARPQRYNVGVAFEPAELQRLLAPAGITPTGLMAVIGNEYLIIARSRDPEKWVGRSASPAFKSRIQSGGVGFAESTTLDGVASLTYLTRPNAQGWSVVSAIPKSELAAAAWRASAKAMVASAALLLFLLVIALYAARVISDAVQLLEKAADDLGNNVVPVLQVSGVPEFDTVAGALHAAGVKANEATATLERRVEQAVRDASDAQEKLAHSRKLELVGRLTAGVAHDFNNLLQTITVSHQLLQLRIDGDKERRALAGAVRATSKATDLVKQLMLLGRVQKLEPRLVDLADVVLKEHELTSKAVGPKVVLSAELEPNLPSIYVDPVQLEMALLNLVFNARDALPTGGNITVRARLASPAEVQTLGAGSFIRLDVSDDGIGMDEETRAKAFEPFFTTKAPGVGTGMGLAQVHAFASESGGEIRLASEPGRGTCVTLYLPVATLPAEVVEPKAVEPVATRVDNLRVLLVEDDLLVASVVTAALEGRGCQLRACKDADEAIRVMGTGEPFDVLFTDVVMPGSMNGIELAGWAKEHRPDLAVVVATGYADNVSDISVPVLRKPYGIEAAHALLQDACVRHAQQTR
ncbi:MAG: hybrid sensor histidine kinase/response regulator [Rubrivivax sp.]|nr:MAG: hybrid sensor histidine kinase/response regulator [Rubrivivax sp.]